MRLRYASNDVKDDSIAEPRLNTFAAPRLWNSVRCQEEFPISAKLDQQLSVHTSYHLPNELSQDTGNRHTWELRFHNDFVDCACPWWLAVIMSNFVMSQAKALTILWLFHQPVVDTDGPGSIDRHWDVTTVLFAFLTNCPQNSCSACCEKLRRVDQDQRASAGVSES